MRISDWSSDVCSSDLTERVRERQHEGFLRYAGFRWARISGALCLLVIVSYALVDVTPRHNGGSWYGYTLGTIGAGLILWLTALGYRKRKMTNDYWSLKAWTSAHVYLGLSLMVVGTWHNGFSTEERRGGKGCVRTCRSSWWP